MQKHFLTVFIALSVLSGLTNCSDDDKTSPTDINFSITFKPVFKHDGQYELVVLSSDNRLLKKERITRFTTSNIHVSSPTETVNIVVVDTLRFPGGGVRYNMMAFLHVSPSAWDLFPAQPVVDAPSANGGTAVYLNIPESPDENLYFVNTAGLPLGDPQMTEPNTAMFYYHETPDDYTYLLIPGLAKYKFTKMETSDPIDVSTMETAVKVKLTGQPESIFHSCRLVGYPESGNLDKQLAIYPESAYFNYTDFDYMYPDTHFAHYELFYESLESNAHHNYRVFSNTAPTSVSLFNDAQHQVTQEDLQVNLSYQTKIPTLTNLWLTCGNIDLFVSCPSEISAFKYDEFLRDLQSELLPQSTAPYDFKLEQYKLTSVAPLGYADYLNLLFSSEPKQKQLTEETEFLRDLR